MSKFAMIGADGAVRRVSTDKPHPGALPVVYPDKEGSKRQRPPQDWKVYGDKVVVTYYDEPRGVERARSVATRGVRRQRRRALSVPVEVEISSGEVVEAVPDDAMLARLASARWLYEQDPDRGALDWQIKPGEWVSLEYRDLEKLSLEVSKRIQQAFSRQRELEQKINEAETVLQVQRTVKGIDSGAGRNGQTGGR